MKVAVIGGGIMGNGIAQVSAMAGHDVTLSDVGESELARAISTIELSLGRFVKASKITESEGAAARGRLRCTTDLPAAVSNADVVVEAVPEVIDLKIGVWKTVASAAPESALLATNTSQLSITRIGAPLGKAAERLVGTHFFNPPVMMRLVELVRGESTTDDTIERARAFATGLGKVVVVCQKDSPGFITSRAYIAMRLECLRILEEGVATREDIDTAMKLGFNLPMGPLELGDFNGLDTNLYVLNALREAFGERFNPTVTLRNLVAAGKLGRKTGEGFYKYDADGKRVNPPK